MTGAKAGSAVPMKFSLGGDYGLSILAAGSPSSAAAACTTGAVESTADPAFAPGSSTLAYDPVTDTYSYVWKTNKDWAGTCRVFTLKLDDGTAHTATFQFTK